MKKIKSLQTAAIGKITPGTIVKIRGIVLPMETLTSRKLGSSCVYSRYLLETYKKRGKRFRWGTELDEEKTKPFLIDDGTGKVQIDLTGADNYWIDGEKSFENETQDDSIRSFTIDLFPPQNNTREKEWIIREGDSLLVYGKAILESGKIVIKKEILSPMIASVHSEEAFFAKIRSDDFMQITRIVLSLIVGGLLIGWLFRF